MLWKTKLTDVSNNGKNAEEIALTCKEVDDSAETVAMMYVNPRTMLALIGFAVTKAHAIGGVLYSQYMGHPIKEDEKVPDNTVMIVSYETGHFNALRDE